MLLPRKRSVCPLREAYRRAIPYILGVYILGVAAAFLFLNMRLTVEWVAIILFVAAILSGRGLLFLRDWGVFIAVLLAWQVASPLATRFSFPWHLQEMISADKLMFSDMCRQYGCSSTCITGAYSSPGTCWLRSCICCTF